MHWPDPAQRPRIVEIRDNLIARIDEAEREGWLGEVQGLTISLAGANDKLAQIDQRPPTTAVNLGMPTNGKNNHPQTKIISSENPKASHLDLAPTNLTPRDLITKLAPEPDSTGSSDAGCPRAAAWSGYRRVDGMVLGPGVL